MRNAQSGSASCREHQAGVAAIELTVWVEMWVDRGDTQEAYGMAVWDSVDSMQ